MIDVKKKIAGVLIPAFALRREGDLGIGDTLALKQSIEFCARNNLSVLQVLPINETGGDNSPYGAISSVALDPILLTVDPDCIPGLDGGDFERMVAESGIRNVDPCWVHYDIARKLKLDLLRSAWARFKSAHAEDGGDGWQEFEQFQKEHESWLPYYTLFRTLMDLHGGNACWTSWPSEQQTYDGAQVWLAGSELKGELEDRRGFCAFVQWRAFKQWLELRHEADRHGVKLMGDIPFGVSRYSCDVWAERSLFDLEWSGGAPPEPLFQGDPFVTKWGQNWGIPLYKWAVHKKENYRWWRQRIGRLTDVFHYFRIDHVLGFFRIYAFPWIPERNDEFVKLTEKEAEKITKGKLPHFIPRNDYPEKLGKLNAAEGAAILKVILDAAGENGVVAEDLGVVPPYVRPLLRKMGIPGFAIPIFERHEKDRSFKKKEELHPVNMATYGTHDHMPLSVYYEDLSKRWHGPNGHEAWLDVQRLMRFLGLDEDDPPVDFTDELHGSFCKTLLETPCWLAMYMIPDILGSGEQFNAPGTGTGNWTRRLSMTLDAFESDPYFGAKIKRLSSQIRASGRH
jgi:4-alpha-glucanotransferase